MATGMVSSASTLQNLKAKTAEPILRAGESVSTSVDAAKDPNAKTYYHMANGARFVMPDGLEVRFMGGQFTTADADIIAELDKVANKSASMIFTKREVIAVVAPTVHAAAAAEAADTAGTFVEQK